MNNLSGNVAVELSLDGAEIHRVKVKCVRPNVGRSLVGMTAAQAQKTIAILYALCPVAQQQASESALGLKLGLSSDAARMEWVKEHSWQSWLMLDDICMGDDALTATVEVRKGDKQAANLLYGLAPEQWLSFGSKRELQHWMAGARAPYAKLLNALYHSSARGFGTRVKANGPLRRCQAHDYVGYFDAECGELFMRTLARLIELAQLLSGGYLPPKAKVLASGHVEIEASRGRLVHQVAFENGNNLGAISAYQIEAPTDRHCDESGTLAQSLQGSVLPNQDPMYAHLLIKTFDPCVSYSLTMESCHA